MTLLLPPLSVHLTVASVHFLAIASPLAKQPVSDAANYSVQHELLLPHCRTAAPWSIAPIDLSPLHKPPLIPGPAS